jgi:alpha-tubulin suppressor-like RCC1 family protein
MTRRIREVRLRGASLAICLAGAVFSGISCRDDNSVGPTDPGAPEPGQALAITTAAALAFRQVSVGSDHTCGVTTDDRAYCWGVNAFGQLGDGTTTLRTRPVAVAGGLSFREVTAGMWYTCGVTTDDRAFCWGSNGTGQLGNGDQGSCGAPNPPCGGGGNPDRIRPAAVLGGLYFRQLDAGTWHTCGVTRENVAYCWGNNRYGQLGDGATGLDARYLDRPTPVRVFGGLSFRQVSAGGVHTCGVATDSRAFCWGNNRYGQVGDGTTVRQRLQPTLVAGGRLFTQVSAGGEQQGSGYTCGITTGERAFCWGDGRNGQIGDGNTIVRLTPRAVAGGRSFGQVSAGVDNTCARTPANVAYCWGYNFFGEVGDGTTTRRLRPVPVRGGLSFSQLSTGSGHTCGRTTAAAAYCWGFNRYGALGDGTRTDRLTPRAVVGPM